MSFDERISRRNLGPLAIGALSAGAATIPELGPFFGQNEKVFAGEVPRDASFLDGCDLLWRKTEETGHEYMQVFVLYEDGKSVWVPMHVESRGTSFVSAKPVWNGVETRGVRSVIEVHTHPADSVETFIHASTPYLNAFSIEQLRAQMVPGNLAAEPPSLADVGVAPNTLYQRLDIPFDAQGKLIGAVKVKAGLYFFSQQTKEFLLEHYRHTGGFDTSFLDARNAYEVLQAELTPELKNTIQQASIAQLQGVLNQLLDPSDSTFTNAQRLSREISSAIVENREIDHRTRTGAHEYILAQLHHLRGQSGRLNQLNAIVILATNNSELFRKYVSAMENAQLMRTEIDRLVALWRNAFVSFGVASSRYNGDEAAFLPTENGRSSFNNLQRTYATFGAYVYFKSNEQLRNSPLEFWSDGN